jgi:hypothetical protein
MFLSILLNVIACLWPAESHWFMDLQLFIPGSKLLLVILELISLVSHWLHPLHTLL